MKSNIWNGMFEFRDCTGVIGENKRYFDCVWLVNFGPWRRGEECKIIILNYQSLELNSYSKDFDREKIKNLSIIELANEIRKFWDSPDKTAKLVSY